MKLPEKREQVGEQISSTRSMSSSQKLSITALIAKRISNNDTTSLSFEEVRPTLGNSRANASRELMLPINVDIAKIISDDSAEENDDEDDEEDAPEILPEVSERLLT